MKFSDYILNIIIDKFNQQYNKSFSTTEFDIYAITKNIRFDMACEIVSKTDTDFLRIRLYFSYLDKTEISDFKIENDEKEGTNNLLNEVYVSIGYLNIVDINNKVTDYSCEYPVISPVYNVLLSETGEELRSETGELITIDQLSITDSNIVNDVIYSKYSYNGNKPFIEDNVYLYANGPLDKIALITNYINNVPAVPSYLNLIEFKNNAWTIDYVDNTSSSVYLTNGKIFINEHADRIIIQGDDYNKGGTSTYMYIKTLNEWKKITYPFISHYYSDIFATRDLDTIVISELNNTIGLSKIKILSYNYNISLYTDLYEFTLESLLDNSNINWFGRKITINENKDTIAIANNTDSNKIFIIKKINNFWQQLNTLSPIGVTIDIKFGNNLKFSKNGNKLFISAIDYNDLNYDKTGCIYVYKLLNNQYVLDTIIKENIGSTNSNFGYSFDVNDDGNKLLVSNNKGKVYLYKLDTSWILDKEFLPDIDQVKELQFLTQDNLEYQFGKFVKISNTGNKVLISSNSLVLFYKV